MNDVAMDPALKAKWIDKLRDPETKKGFRRLERQDGSQCCLGVLANLVGIPKQLGADSVRQSGNNQNLPPIVYYFLFPGYPGGLNAMPPYDAFPGISADAMNVLAQMNDRNPTFAKIIEYIEKML